MPALPRRSRPQTTPSAATLPAPVPPAPAPPDNCAKGVWPSVAEGRPGSFQAGDDGAYLWYDPDGGWALRFTHAGPHDEVVFSGMLTTEGQFVDVHRTKGERDGIVLVGRDGHTIVFRFVGFGWSDGLDFATHCSEGFDANILIGEQLASTASVHLGSTEAQPTSNPFKVERVGSTTRTSSTTTSTTSTTTGSTTTTTTYRHRRRFT